MMGSHRHFGSPHQARVCHDGDPIGFGCQAGSAVGAATAFGASERDNCHVPSPASILWRVEEIAMALTIRPLHPNFVAEISGLDMRVPPDAALMRSIIEAADTYAVLV